MRDPGYIPERGWNQEAPYRDLDHFDYDADEVINDEALQAERNILEPRSSWLHRTIADRRAREREDLEAAMAAQPTGLRTPGAGSGAADCGADNPLTPTGTPPLVGVTSL